MQLKSVLITALIALLLADSLSAQAQRPVQQDAIPEVLRDWQQWVLQDREFVNCPLVSDGKWGVRPDHVCSWPGRLQLELDDQGGEFLLTWHLQQPDTVALPGAGNHRAHTVTVNGEPANVQFYRPDSILYLDAGVHTISGQFSWETLPESLYLPEQLVLFDLSVNGETITAPQFDRQNASRLLLQVEQPVDAAASHSIKVSRFLTDAIPTLLATFIEIDVSGPAREIELGELLPPGFSAYHYMGELPLRFEPENATLFARPGSWKMRFDARADTLLNTIGLAVTPASNGEEVWAVTGTPGVRSFRVEGLSAVDPGMVFTPWDAVYPTYQFRVGQQLNLLPLQRGMMADSDGQPSLERRLWLSHDARTWTASDRLWVEDAFIQRLETQAPWQLQSAFESLAGNTRHLLVTQQTDSDNRGVEVRGTDLSLNALLTSAADGSKVAANGWSTTLKSAAVKLELGPGFQLLATRGVDSDNSSWLSQWKLFDWFVLLLVTLAMFYAVGWHSAAITLLAGLLSWQLGAGFLYVLLFSALILITLREFNHYRFAVVVRFTGYIVVGMGILGFVVFSASQLAYSLYPQLHHGASPLTRTFNAAFADHASRSRVPAAIQSEVAYAPSPEEGFADLERIVVTGSQIKNTGNASDALSKTLPEGNVPQAGPGRPDWQWYTHRLSINASVAADQSMALYILSPWQVVVWRLVMLISLGLALLAVTRQLLKFRRRQPTSNLSGQSLTQALVLGVLSCSVLSVAPVSAQSLIPDEAILNELRDRLQPGPDCLRDCTTVSTASLQLDGDSFALQLRLHVARHQEVQLPVSDSLRLVSAQLNGQLLERIRTRSVPERSIVGVPLPVGIHRLSLNYRVDAGDSFSLQFPLLPGLFDADIQGWQMTGVRSNQWVGNQLSFQRLVSVGADENSEQGLTFSTQLDIEPYARLKRIVRFDNEWTVETVVTKFAPAVGNISLAVPLLPGEQPLSNELDISAGVVQVVTSGVERWISRLDRVNELRLVASQRGNYAEEWLFGVNQQYHVEFSGVPVSADGLSGDYQEHVFYPLPGEKLKVRISQPEPVIANTLAVDAYNQRETLGRGIRNNRLDLTVRTGIAQDFRLQLPDNAELEQVELNGQEQQQEVVDGTLTIPLSSGIQQLAVTYRQQASMPIIAHANTVSLEVPLANIRHQLAIGQPRWVLWVGGDGVKPAVLYWSQLVAMLVVVFLLTRLGWTPLRWWHWLLLGLGFSTINWGVALLVAVWLHMASWCERTPMTGNKGNLLQLLMLALGALSLLVVINTLPQSMLSSPGMHIAGNGSSAGQLNWFLDYSSSVLPDRWVFSLPLWCYQAFILIWALWLAVMLIRWLRWSLKVINWQSWQRPGRAPAAEPAEVENQ